MNILELHIFGLKYARSFSVILLVLCAAVFTDCGANIFSTKQEVKMGGEFAAAIENQTKMYDDPEWNEYVNGIGQRIAAICDRRDISYTFKIIDNDSTVNAFAVPGGFIYIYTGLLLEAENEAELAGVLAHEVGHVVGKHSVKQLTKVLGFQFLIAVALGQNPGQLEKVASDFFAGGLILNYGRQNEFESDYYGVTYIYALNYDPSGFKTFLQKLKVMGGDARKSGFLTEMMSTHPPPDKRIEKVQEVIDTLPAKENAVINRDKYLKLRSKLEKKVK